MKKCLKASLLCLLLYSNIYTYMFEKPFNWNRKKNSYCTQILLLLHNFNCIFRKFTTRIIIKYKNTTSKENSHFTLQLLFFYFFTPFSHTKYTSSLRSKKNACESKIRPKHFPRKITAIIMGIHKSPFLFLQCLKITKKSSSKIPKLFSKNYFEFQGKNATIHHSENLFLFLFFSNIVPSSSDLTKIINWVLTSPTFWKN